MISSLLIIDDDTVFRTRLLRAFKARGILSYGASNGAEALSHLQEHDIEAALLDMKLEDESGLDILPKLLKHTPSLRVVILTGYGTIGTTVSALKLGAENYLTKPLDADAILDAFEDTDSQREPGFPPLSQIEWDHIQRVLKEVDGNITRASEVLGIHRRSLQRKLAKDPGKLL